MWYESHESKERTTEICARMFDSAFQIRLFSLMLPYATNAPIRSLRNHFTPLYSWEFCHLMKKKSNLARAAHFFVHFFAVVFHDCNVKLLSYTFYRGNVVLVLVHYFSLPLFFTLHWWPLAFLILSPPLQSSHVVLLAKKTSSLFFYLSLYSSDPLFLVELRCPAAYCLFFSVFLLFYIPNLWTWQLL